MLGTLTQYLRFMGYDTRSANELKPGNSREDTELLELAERGDRILLTRDAELARRGGGAGCSCDGRRCDGAGQSADGARPCGTPTPTYPMLDLQQRTPGCNFR